MCKGSCHEVTEGLSCRAALCIDNPPMSPRIGLPQKCNAFLWDSRKGGRVESTPLPSFRPTRGGMPACGSISTMRRTSPKGAKFASKACPSLPSFRPTRGGMPACRSISTMRRTSSKGAKSAGGGVPNSPVIPRNEMTRNPPTRDREQKARRSLTYVRDDGSGARSSLAACRLPPLLLILYEEIPRSAAPHFGMTSEKLPCACTGAFSKIHQYLVTLTDLTTMGISMGVS